MFVVVVFALLVHCGRETVAPPIVDDNPPATPTGLSVYRARDGEIDLVWDSNYEDNLAGYKVYRTQTNPGGQYQLLWKTSYTNFVDKGLDYNTTYYYRITAYNTNGLESAPSDSVWGTPYNMYPPSMPQNLLARAHNNDDGISITLLWIPNTEGDLAGYKIYRSAADNMTPDATNFLDTIPPCGIPYADVKNIRIGIRYYYRIIAFDKGGWQSTPSYTASDIVLDRPQLVSPPANATVIVQPIFEWRPVANANEYIIFVSTARYSNEIWSAVVNATSDSIVSVFYTGPPLYSGRSYYWKVGTVTNDEQDPNSLSETRMFFIGVPESRISEVRHIGSR